MNNKLFDHSNPLESFIRREDVPDDRFPTPQPTKPRPKVLQPRYDPEVQTTELVTRATHPWDRQPQETGQAYLAFCIYRDMGPERTFIGVAKVLEAESTRQMQKWSATYNWVARARSYDEWDEKRTRRVAERARLEAARRQARLGQRMQEMASTAMGTKEEPGTIIPESVRDVVTLAEAGSRIERLALGQSTENVASGLQLVLTRMPTWAPVAAKELATIEGEGGDSDGGIGTDSAERTED